MSTGTNWETGWNRTTQRTTHMCGTQTKSRNILYRENTTTSGTNVDLQINWARHPEGSESPGPTAPSCAGPGPRGFMEKPQTGPMTAHHMHTFPVRMTPRTLKKWLFSTGCDHRGNRSGSAGWPGKVGVRSASGEAGSVGGGSSLENALWQISA